MIHTKELESIDPNALFTVQEVARILDMSKNGVRNWIIRGSIPAQRRGWQYLILGSDILNKIQKAPQAAKTTRAALIDTL